MFKNARTFASFSVNTRRRIMNRRPSLSSTWFKDPAGNVLSVVERT
jgi:hypothetical protein